MDSRVFSRLATVTATALLLAGCSDGDGGSGGAGGTGGDTGTSGGSGGGGAGGQSTTGGTGGSAQGAGTVIGFAWPAGGTTPDLVAIDSATGQLEKLVALPPQADLFDLGTGARRFTVYRPNLNVADLAALRDFWEARNGAYQPFTYNAPAANQATSAVTCRFENEPLSWSVLGPLIASG